MTAISRSSSSTLPTSLAETGPKRKLQMELKEIEEILHKTPLKDPLTDALKSWQKNFSLTVRREADIKSVERHFISEAQQILTDAISSVPLDAQALLGSDGRVYSQKSLILHFDKHPPESICRSPLEPENPHPFVAAPHPPARHLVQWLKKQNALPEVEPFEKAYQEVMAQNPRPFLPPQQTPISSPPIQAPQPQASQIIRNTTELRRIMPDLLKLRDTLDASPLQDEMTEQLRGWQKNFFLALQLDVDKIRVEGEFILLLQQILTDSVSGAPLDEEAYLGSDGRTYGSMSLSLYLHSAPKEYRHRSPLDPQNPAPFTVEPHPPVRSLIQWLKSRQALLHSESIEQAYQILMQQKIAPPPPTERNERIRRLKERQAQRDLQKDLKILGEKAAFDRKIEETRKEVNQTIYNGFALIDQSAEEVTQKQLEQIAVQGKTDQEQLKLLKEAIGLARERGERLANRTLQLQNRLEATEKTLDQAERDNIKLRILINETRQAIDKLHTKRKESVLESFACIVGCAFGTWALQSALVSMGASAGVSIAPIRGGAQFTISTAL